MKPIPLRNIAAPSPSVLNFLRAQVQDAFQSTTVQRGALRNQKRGYAGMSRIGGCLDVQTRGGCMREAGDVALGDARSFAPLKSFRANSRTTRAGLSSCHPLLATTSFCSVTRPNRCHRAFSTTTLDKAWQLFGYGKRGQPARVQGGGQPLKDLMGDSTPGFDVLGRMARPANELKMRCTELDQDGNVTMTSGEFKKSELIAKYGLLPRDLRKIDSSLLPNILVRPTAILINLLHIRALIKHNRVLVFDAYGTSDSKSQSVFMYDLDLKLRQKESSAIGTLPYEFRALEAVLISVTLSLEKEFETVSDPVVRVLMQLEEDIDRDKLRYLLVYSKKLGTFEQKARLVRDALSELLEADDDLAAMYLSEKAEGTVREDEEHTEVEMLLESYHKVADEIVQAAENLVSSIRNTEEIVKAILDANRNSLMLLDLKFSILTLSIAAGTFVAALYGMNLKNFIEETDLGFGAVSAWCTVFGFAVLVWGLTKLRKVQRVSMWGHGGSVRSTTKGWGLGAWGGRSRLESGDGLGVPRLRAGESLGDLIHRERAMARRMAQAEARKSARGETRAVEPTR